MSSSQQPSSAANIFSAVPTRRSYQCYNCNHSFFITRVSTNTASSSSSPPPTSFRCPICFHLHLIAFHTVVPPPPPTSTPPPMINNDQQQDSLSGREDFFQTRITRFINSLPVKEFDTNTTSNESECSICMEEFGGNIVVELPCGHYFDKECIREWIERRRNCPLCRSRLSLGEAHDNEVGLGRESELISRFVRAWQSRSRVVMRGMNEPESSLNAEAREARVLVLHTNFDGEERANAVAREVVRRWVLSMNGGGESSRSTGTTTDDDHGDTMSGDAA